MYWFANIISLDWPIADILVSAFEFADELVLQLFFKARKNLWISDFKWFNYIICLLFNN